MPDFYNIADAVTTSDTVDLFRGPCDAVNAGGAGVIAGVLVDGRVVNFTVAAGEILPFTLRRINATNTTATALVALYSR